MCQTALFHGGNRGSIPLGRTKLFKDLVSIPAKTSNKRRLTCDFWLKARPRFLHSRR